MKQAIMVGISSLLLAVCLPMLLLTPGRAEMPENLLLIIEGQKSHSSEVSDLAEVPEDSLDETYILRLKAEGELREISMDVYLTGVVLSEMPASFSVEALRAQAVAARTFTMRQMQNGKHTDCDVCGDSSCCQAWTSKESLREKLGTSWMGYWEKAAEAVNSTDGEILTYDGELIDAVYFSCSGGTTEPAAAVWGSDIPYLRSVVSAGEEQAGKFESEVCVSKDEFRRILLEENKNTDLSGRAAGWFGETIHSAGGGVYSMEIGGETFYGTKLRHLFGLNSTKFSVAVTEENIVFSVRGFGHGVGMSQYGANAMAQSGETYREILFHYYTDVNLEKVPRP